MITIDQLLESVDLDFEPRWVTKDESGDIYIWGDKPETDKNIWDAPFEIRGKGFGPIRLAEFHNKKWQGCIYEVPHEQNLEKLRPADSDLVYRVKLPRKDKPVVKIEKLERHIRVENGYEISCPPDEAEIVDKINELVDAVNELKGAKNE